jgi:hypothetical protein
MMAEDTLAMALAKAQLQFIQPKKNKTVNYKDRTGRQIKYAYADLADVIEAVKKPLAENNLAYFQLLKEGSENNWLLETTVMHWSGNAISSVYNLPNPANIRAQEFGSALTYARRYSLSAILGIASEEDEDGQIAQNLKPTPPPKKKPKPQLPKLNPEPDQGDISDYVPEFDPNDQFPDFNLGEYVVPFGIYQGRQLNQIDPERLRQYIQTIVKKAKDENKPIQGKVLDFINNVENYIN